MNWLKLITKNGRQSLVREAAREYLTIGKISELAADGVSSVLSKSCGGVDDEKMAKVCGYCRDGATLFAAIADAASDKVVTPEEAAEICMQTARLTGEIITQDRIDAILESIVARVP